MILFNHNQVWMTLLTNIFCQEIGKQVNPWLIKNWKQKKDNTLRKHQYNGLQTRVWDVIEDKCQELGNIERFGYSGFDFHFTNWNPYSVCLVIQVHYYKWPESNDRTISTKKEILRLGPDWNYSNQEKLNTAYPIHKYPYNEVEKALEEQTQIDAEIKKLKERKIEILRQVGHSYFEDLDYKVYQNNHSDITSNNKQT